MGFIFTLATNNVLFSIGDVPESIFSLVYWFEPTCRAQHPFVAGVLSLE